LLATFLEVLFSSSWISNFKIGMTKIVGFLFYCLSGTSELFFGGLKWVDEFLVEVNCSHCLPPKQVLLEFFRNTKIKDPHTIHAKLALLLIQLVHT
jgi:hypothetical protein